MDEKKLLQLETRCDDIHIEIYRLDKRLKTLESLGFLKKIMSIFFS